MLSCLRDTYFSKLDYVGRKEVVLKEIETIINCELTLNNIKLYTGWLEVNEADILLTYTSDNDIKEPCDLLSMPNGMFLIVILSLVTILGVIFSGNTGILMALYVFASDHFLDNVVMNSTNLFSSVILAVWNSYARSFLNIPRPTKSLG